jgi:hypothetical protein
MRLFGRFDAAPNAANLHLAEVLPRRSAEARRSRRLSSLSRGRTASPPGRGAHELDEAPARQTTCSRYLDDLPDAIRTHFDEYPRLLEGFSWRVTVGYVFPKSRWRIARRCTAAWSSVIESTQTSHAQAIDAWDMKRKDFPFMFKAIFDSDLKDDLMKLLRDAEAIRDKNIHGKWCRTSSRDSAKCACSTTARASTT